MELVKSMVNGLNSDFTDTFGGACMSQLEVPNNLTNTFKPDQIVADNFSDGFEKVLDALDQVFSDYRPALFLFGNTDGGGKFFKCQCYNVDDQTSNLTQLRNYINSIFHQMNNRPQLV